jgi:hypothetical protein
MRRSHRNPSVAVAPDRAVFRRDERRRVHAGKRDSALTVAAVALPLLGWRLRVLALVGGERLADLVVGELALVTSAA